MSSTVTVDSQHGRKIFVDLDGYDRVRAHSPNDINVEIEREIRDIVKAYATRENQGLEESLNARIAALDKKWDIDRALMVVFSVLGGTSLALGALKNKKWLALLAIQIPFLAYHATKGWCPPVSVLRRLGFRTSMEIAAEKYALKTLRGDFTQ